VDIESRVVEIYLTVNIFEVPPFQILFEPEDWEDYEMIHSAIQ